MQWYDILILIIVITLLIILLTSYICYLMTFYVGKKKIYQIDEYDIPPGEEYAPYKDMMTLWQKEMRELPHENVQITSFDNLTLHGKYYPCGDSKIIEIMFHGYKGSAERDLCGGIKRAFSINHNVLLVDQRAASRSDGHTISFGVNERHDCMSWLKYVTDHFDKDMKVILTGVSMGAATVILASEMELSNNVIGVLADCSYSTQKDVIKKFIKPSLKDMNIFKKLLTHEIS